MVVSFVNAGLLTLSQSIGVIMGANIGTTVTAWIISALGFKVDIAAMALPLLAVGVPLLFSGKSNRKSIGEFIFGFSFLFMGLSLFPAYENRFLAERETPPQAAHVFNARGFAHNSFERIQSTIFMCFLLL